MTLSHDEAGSGPAVVLLHSTVADRRMWDTQMAFLTSAGFRLVRCDFRGYGETPMPDRPYNDAQDVADLLDALGIERAALIASSGGGRVGLEIAARWPSRVTAMALLNTAMAGHEPGPELRAFGEREDALLEAGDIDAATELNVQTWLGPHADEATRAKVREMQRHAFEVQLATGEVGIGEVGTGEAVTGEVGIGEVGIGEVVPIRVETDLSAITAPTLLISGAHDLPDFRRIAATLSERLSNARLIELDWAGHLPSLERPDVVNPLLLGFLNAG